MRYFTDICSIKDRYGRNKLSKLKEIVTFLNIKDETIGNHAQRIFGDIDID